MAYTRLQTKKESADDAFLKYYSQVKRVGSTLIEMFTELERFVQKIKGMNIVENKWFLIHS